MKTASMIALVSLLISSNSFSNEHGHSLGSHEHGSIQVGIAIEGSSAEIDIDGPAESFLGFEYAPKTSKEKKIFKDFQTKWTQNLESMIAFDKQLNCKVTEASFEQEVEKEEVESKTKANEKKESGVHSDIEAKAKITCAKNISGSMLTISLKKVFKNIKKLTVEVVGADTKKVEITQAVQSFKI
ncbi:MAG: DUF2796 domain-containing protein [Bacteriovoracaceae bacterium]|nr:DUF2796 domain-containing protein [Bacteriovoracaceae bacterium]